LQKINAILRKIEIALGTAFVGLIFVLTSLNIIFRYFFNKPIAWSEEVVTFFFIWIGYLTAAYILSNDDHIRFSYFLDHFSTKLNKIVRIIFNILMIASLVILFPSAVRNISFMSISPSLEIDMAIIYAIVPITYAIMIFHMIVNIMILIKDKRNMAKGAE